LGANRLARRPALLGGIMELPVGVLAGRGRSRRRAVLLGGAAFILTLTGVAAARSFAGLLAGSVAARMDMAVPPPSGDGGGTG
jgi:hypothetical protein